MARYTDANCRLCRREGQKLFLKGERCYSSKCSFETRKGQAPGQHGQSRKKVSEYGLQLRAKQKARRFYGVMENQFYKYYEMAMKQSGVTGENLLRVLESRLDNVVYRCGFASSRKEARQLVLHRHYTVDGVKVNIPSYLVKPGEEIQVVGAFKDSDKFKAITEANGSRPVPKWITVDRDKASAKIVTLPNREDIDLEVEEHLIVELYSK